MSTVFVGLSGGVDSAVSAAVLKQAGHSVVGCFIKIWRPEFTECPWREDRLDAMRVAAALEISFREVDLSEEYKSAVIEDMIARYARGITPNPDVLCNRHIKFGSFAKWARAEGAEYIATGHYARNAPLRRGKDLNKDQSYFLWQLTPDDLRHVLFPIGELVKSEVRIRARKFGLPNAAKKDSQGLCFVGDITLREFLSNYIPLQKGDVVDERGDRIGEHDGAALYTLGERHGFRISTPVADGKPYFVTGIDTLRNVIHVSPDISRAYVVAARLLESNWHTLPRVDATYAAQARYRETAVPVKINGDIITFNSPHLAPPGQSLVIYDGDTLIGGGIIAQTI